MRSIFILISVSIIAFIGISCKSGPEPLQQVSPETPETAEFHPVEIRPANPVEVFDPTRISREYYDTTREEVREFIEELNRIIRNRNYNAWRAALSPEYFAEISSAENLRNISDLPAMKARNIVLRTARDYFDHVVVPSRANLRVDDIEFISLNRVKAFTFTTNRAGEEIRLRLYDLEKINNTWTIIN